MTKLVLRAERRIRPAAMTRSTADAARHVRLVVSGGGPPRAHVHAPEIRKAVSIISGKSRHTPTRYRVREPRLRHRVATPGGKAKSRLESVSSRGRAPGAAPRTRAAGVASTSWRAPISRRFGQPARPSAIR